MTIRQIVPELMSANVAVSIAFYRDVIGLPVLAVAPTDGPPSWAALGGEGQSVMIQGRTEFLSEIPALAERAVGGTAVVVLRVASRAVIDQVMARLPQESKVVLPRRQTEYGTTEVGFTDPDGYVVLLAAEEAS